MKVVFLLGWSDSVPEREFRFDDWKLPLPRKGESLRLYATYKGERNSSMELIEKRAGRKVLTLCHFHTERVTYQEDLDYVEIQVSFVVPVLKN